jgi:hypothetical protein
MTTRSQVVHGIDQMAEIAAEHSAIGKNVLSTIDDELLQP